MYLVDMLDGASFAKEHAVNTCGNINGVDQHFLGYKQAVGCRGAGGSKWKHAQGMYVCLCLILFSVGPQTLRMFFCLSLSAVSCQ